MMILNVGERLLALQILPREGNFLTLAVKRELISKLGITPEDIANTRGSYTGEYLGKILQRHAKK